MQIYSALQKGAAVPNEDQFRDTVVALVQQAAEIVDGQVSLVTVYVQSNGQYPYQIAHSDDDWPWAGYATDKAPPENIGAPLGAEPEFPEGDES